MTERTIRHLAKQLAGAFYEQSAGDMFGTAPEDRERSARFRATFPTYEHYKKGYQVQTNGKIKQGEPGWVFFVTLARARLVQMLGDSTKKNLHEAIYKSLLEEHQKSTSPLAQEVLQRRLNGGVSISGGR